MKKPYLLHRLKTRKMNIFAKDETERNQVLIWRSDFNEKLKKEEQYLSVQINPSNT